jgi:predicted esterase
MQRALLLAVVVLGSMLTSARTEAQTRPAFFGTPSSIEIVGMIRPQERVPLIVLLPPTGGDARVVMPPPDVMGPYLVLVTPGVPQASDYLPGFSHYLDWAEARILADIDRAIAERPVDPDRIYLAGFSLGGDVAWGLLTRHPERFRGAVVMGSRSAAAARSGTLATMHTRQMRLAFVIGASDEANRRRGIQHAYDVVHRASIESRILEFPGAHEMPPEELYAEALSFVLGRTTE